MNKSILLSFTLLCITLCCNGQDSLWQRKYQLGIFNNYDLRNSSTNAIGIYRLINDGTEFLIDSQLPPKAGTVTKSIVNFATVYLSMLWSHEFGHSIRAQQVGGRFNIHNFGLPVPYTTADLPADISLIDEAAFVTAGFEVNYLNIRKIQSDFLRYNGLWNEDLAFSFANRLMYPVYTTLIVPIDPKDKEVWINTAGDPVHYILPVFKNYSNDRIFTDEGNVNPELSRFYTRASILAQLFHFLDPQFYREIGGAFGRASKLRRPIFLIGDYNNGWTYGTLFNASPLGYELYIQNYLHLNNRQYGIYFKYGSPFRNNGIGLSMNDVFDRERFSTDLKFEMWDQEFYNLGFSIEAESQWNISESFGFNCAIGYKSEGYSLGKQLDSGLILGFGICIINHKKQMPKR